MILIVIGILCPFRVCLDFCLIPARLSPLCKPVSFALSSAGTLAASAFFIENRKDLRLFSRAAVSILTALNILCLPLT